jgi:outer membrane protein
MTKKLLTLSLSFALILSGQAFSQATTSSRMAFTIDRVMARVMTNQPLIDQAEADLRAAQSRTGGARSSYFPKVTGSASWDHKIPQEQATLGSAVFTMTPADYFDIHAGVSELIYDFGKRDFQVKLAQSGEENARLDLERIKSNIAYQTAQTFYTILFLRQEVEDINEQLANLEQHLDDARAREETGSSTHYDVLTTEVSVASVKSQRIEAASKLDNEKAMLAQLMGLGPAEDFTIEGTFAPADIGNDVEALVEKAWGSRSELREAVQAEKTADLNRALASLGNKPSLSASSALGFKNDLFTVDDIDVNDLQFNWSVGFILNVPIFDGFLTANQVAEASNKLVSAKDNTSALRRSIRTEVEQALRNIVAAREQVQNSLAQLEQARESLDIAKTQYEVGAATNLQYLDSQTSLELAKLNNLTALYHEMVSQLQLKQAIGEKI